MVVDAPEQPLGLSSRPGAQPSGAWSPCTRHSLPAERGLRVAPSWRDPFCLKPYELAVDLGVRLPFPLLEKLGVWPLSSPSTPAAAHLPRGHVGPQRTPLPQPCWRAGAFHYDAGHTVLEKGKSGL